MTVNAAVAAVVAAILIAQADTAQNGAAAVKESLAQNQTRLRTYTWVETTQVSMKGEVKKQEQKQCFYAADGKVQKTPIGAAPASPAKQPAGGGGRRGGRVKEKIVESKVDDLKDYMERVVALVHQYVPPDPQKIQDAQTAGSLSAQPTGAVVNLSIKNYLKPGDLVAIGFDTQGKQLSSYNVQSFVEKPKEDDVKLAVTFGRLEDGTSHPQQILLDATAKKIQVKVTNSGYKKAGS